MTLFLGVTDLLKFGICVLTRSLAFAVHRFQHLRLDLCTRAVHVRPCFYSHGRRV